MIQISRTVMRNILQLDEIVTIANILLTNVKYEELREALSNVRRKAIRTGQHKLNEHVLLALLHDHRCAETESYESLRKSKSPIADVKYIMQFIENPIFGKGMSSSRGALAKV